MPEAPPVLDPKTAVEQFRSSFGELMKDVPSEKVNDGTTAATNAPNAADAAASDAGGSVKPVAGAAKPNDDPGAGAKVVADPPDDKWPRTAEEWKKFKTARKERETVLAKERDDVKGQLDSVKAEIETLRKAGPSPELEALKKERDQLSDNLRLVAVENHPKFKAYFENKTAAQMELAKRIVGQDKAEDMARLLQLPDGEWKDAQIEELIADLPPLKQSQMGSVLNALTGIQVERSSEIARAKENYDKLIGEQKAAGDKQRQSIEKMFSDAVSKAQDAKEGVAAYQKKEGDVAWNSAVEERIATAKGFLMGNGKPEAIVQASLSAAMMPAILDHAKAMHLENDKLKAQIAELTKASPKLEGQTPESGSEGNVPVRINAGMNPMEAGREFFKVLQAERGG